MRTALLVCLFVLASCSWLKSSSKPVAGAAVDCATSKAKAALHEFGPTVETVVRGSLDNEGKLDRRIVKDAAKSFAADVGGCVLRDVFARLLAPVADGGIQSEAQLVDRDDATRAWEELRTETLAGAVYK